MALNILTVAPGAGRPITRPAFFLATLVLGGGIFFATMLAGNVPFPLDWGKALLSFLIAIVIALLILAIVQKKKTSAHPLLVALVLGCVLCLVSTVFRAINPSLLGDSRVIVNPFALFVAVNTLLWLPLALRNAPKLLCLLLVISLLVCSFRLAAGSYAISHYSDIIGKEREWLLYTVRVKMLVEGNVTGQQAMIRLQDIQNALPRFTTQPPYFTAGQSAYLLSRFNAISGLAVLAEKPSYGFRQEVQRILHYMQDSWKKWEDKQRSVAAILVVWENAVTLFLVAMVAGIAAYGFMALRREARYAYERREIGEELRVSNIELHTIFSNSSEGIIIYAKDGSIRSFNKEAERIFGYKADEIIGNNIHQLRTVLYSDEGIEAPWYMREFSTKMEEREIKGRHKNGKMFCIELSVVPSPPEAAPFFVCFIRDVTDVKEMESSLQHNAQLLTLINRSSQEGIWDFNIQSGEIWLSARWKEMLGYKDYELKNSPKTVMELMPPDDYERSCKLINTHIRTNIPFQGVFKFRHKNGSIRYIMSRAHTAKNCHGEPVRMVGTHTDVTELILAQERLHQYESGLVQEKAMVF